MGAPLVKRNIAMGMTYNYIAAAEDDADLQFDVEAVGNWLVENQIVDHRKPPEVRYGGLQTIYDRGFHSERLFNPDFTGPNGEETVRERVLESAIFQWDLTIYSLAKPLAIPTVTHRYPIHCPGCDAPCDEAFQQQWMAGHEGKDMECFLRCGLDSTFTFSCHACSRSITVAEVSKQGPMLMRRHFIELEDSSYHTDKVEFLSEAARIFLASHFGGLLAVRSGWIT